jgi:hypothetical protein
MTNETTEFSLRIVVREAIANSTSAEYKDIAAEVLDAIDPTLIREALRQALPHYVRDIAVRERGSGPAIIPVATGTSAKVQAIREDWQRRLTEIYPTPTGNKRLGDLTYADLMHQAKVCQEAAEATMAKAKGWENLARAVRKGGAKTVRDLAPEVLGKTLRDVA